MGDKQPPLAALVMAGEGQSEAAKITNFVHMAKDISNAYLINTDDGDLLVNSGFPANGLRNKALFDPVRTGPLRYIIVTQSHPDHYGGVPTLKEAGTQVIAQAAYPDSRRYFRELHSHVSRRSGKLWASTIKRDGPPPLPPEVEADILVDRELTIELGGRRFDILSTPGGEAVDGLTVWMPNERIAFTGNLFGPVFLSMPFLVTLRGDKPRLVERYLASLDKVRALGAELLITGHGEPIHGAERIRADLTRMHDAVDHIRRATIDGMNASKDVHTLMREVTLPEALKIGEYHGKVSWAVRSIWEEYSGWFHYDSTTSLYGVPRTSIDGDLAELAGGADALVARARARFDGGQPLEAMHLIDIALGAEPGNAAGLGLKRQVLDHLLAASGGTNLSETMWLRSEIADTARLLDEPND